MEETKNKISYKFSSLEKFYREINPNVTIEANGLLYFNSNDELLDNAFPQMLNDVYQNTSSVHSNFINLKRNMIYSEGFKPISGNNSTDLQKFILHENKVGDNLNDILMKASLDMAIHEAIAIEVLYNSEGKIADIYHIDVSNIRAEKPDEFGIVNCFYLSTKWAKITNKVNRRNTITTAATKLPRFNPATWEEDGGIQLYYINRYTSGQEVYSIPSYVSILNYANLQNEIGKFELNKLEKGMLASGMLVIPGDPSEEQKNSFINNMEKKYIGSTGNKVIYSWKPEDSTNKPEWIPLETEDKSSNNAISLLNDMASQSIATGHGGSLTLAGIEGKGADLGGDSNKLLSSLGFYQKNIIRPMQTTILNGFNKILAVNELGKIEIPYVPLIVESTSIVPIKNNISKQK